MNVSPHRHVFRRDPCTEHEKQRFLNLMSQQSSRIFAKECLLQKMKLHDLKNKKTIIYAYYFRKMIFSCLHKSEMTQLDDLKHKKDYFQFIISVK